MAQRNIQHAIFEKDWPHDLSAYSDAWIIGGDGTINFFLNKYAAPAIPLAIFKGGTGNDFYWKLYGDLSEEQQLDLVLHSPTKPVDIGLCNEKYYSNSSGIGFDGQVLKSMKPIRKIGGHLGYLLIVIKTIFSFKEPFLKVQAGKDRFEERFLLASVNNSSRTGGGFMVLPQASVNDGLLDLMLCKPLGIFQRLRYLPYIEKGTHTSLPFFFFGKFEEVVIDCTEDLYAQLDGELIQSKKFHYKVMPGRLNIRY